MFSEKREGFFYYFIFDVYCVLVRSVKDLFCVSYLQSSVGRNRNPQRVARDKDTEGPAYFWLKIVDSLASRFLSSDRHRGNAATPSGLHRQELVFLIM